MSTAPLRLLIVDDNADLRRLLQFRLGVEQDLVVVGEAADGAAALAMAAGLTPDVVLLDLAMPIMDGLEALPRLRALLPATRIVVLSGFDEQSFRTRVLALGGDEYVEKGTSLDDLLEVILRLAGRTADRVIDLNAAEGVGPEPRS